MKINKKCPLHMLFDLCFIFQDSYIEEDIDTPIESLKRGDLLPDDKIDFSLTVDTRIQVKAPVVSTLILFYFKRRRRGRGEAMWFKE